MFEMKFRTDNEAFTEDGGEEIARLLAKAAEQVKSGSLAGFVYDVNGNKVGSWSLEREDDE